MRTGWRSTPSLEGGAWIYLQMVLKGRMEPAPGFFRRLENAFCRVLSLYGKIEFGGVFIGTGGSYLLAEMASRISPRFRRFTGDLFRIWKTRKVRADMNEFNFGHAGSLICLAELQDLVPDWNPPVGVMKRWHNALVKTLASIRKGKKPFELGFSHGISGILLALEVSRGRFSFSTPRSLLDWTFQQLMEEQYRVSGSSLWPISTEDEDITQNNWCHGAPGIALSLLGCHRWSGRKDYLDLFKRAAKGAEEYGSPDQLMICCGRAGRANLFMEAYRFFRRESWIRKAKKVLPKTARKILSPEFYTPPEMNTLFLGPRGVAYTYDRIRCPDLALPGTGFAGNVP